MAGVPLKQKYTVVSKGIWEWIHQKLSIAPNRSTGNPIVGWYRTPAPGSRSTRHMDHEGGSYPAIDIAENGYRHRDHRRNYPQTSVYNQSSVAGLLRYGSVASPRIAKGEEGNKQLATVANGEVSLTSVLSSPDISKDVLDERGLPPIPAQLHRKTYRLLDFKEHGMYSDDYPIRVFK